MKEEHSKKSKKQEEYQKIIEEQETYIEIRKNVLEDKFVSFIDEEDDNEVLNKMVNRTYFTVIIYDITDDKIRRKVVKALLAYTERVQYSGFEGYLTQKQIDRLSLQLKKIINHELDRIRIYKMSNKPQVEVFGNIPMTFEQEYTII